MISTKPSPIITPLLTSSLLSVPPTHLARGSTGSGLHFILNGISNYTLRSKNGIDKNNDSHSIQRYQQEYAEHHAADTNYNSTNRNRHKEQEEEQAPKHDQLQHKKHHFANFKIIHPDPVDMNFTNYTNFIGIKRKNLNKLLELFTDEYERLLLHKKRQPNTDINENSNENGYFHQKNIIVAPAAAAADDVVAEVLVAAVGHGFDDIVIVLVRENHQINSTQTNLKLLFENIFHNIVHSNNSININITNSIYRQNNINSIAIFNYSIINNNNKSNSFADADDSHGFEVILTPIMMWSNNNISDCNGCYWRHKYEITNNGNGKLFLTKLSNMEVPDSFEMAAIYILEIFGSIGVLVWGAYLQFNLFINNIDLELLF